MKMNFNACACNHLDLSRRPNLLGGRFQAMRGRKVYHPSIQLSVATIMSTSLHKRLEAPTELICLRRWNFTGSRRIFVSIFRVSIFFTHRIVVEARTYHYQKLLPNSPFLCLSFG